MANDETSPDDANSPDLVKLGAYWKGELETSARYFQNWRTRCERIEKIYLQQDSAQQTTAKRNFAMLWANISVLQPAVYAGSPKPAVDRRFKDSDPVARTASEMLERNLSFLMDAGDIDGTMEEVRDDFLLCARGTAWLRYEADIEPQEIGDDFSEGAQGFQSGGMGDNGGPPLEQIADERVCIDYVHWSDFLHGPARKWKDVPWVARRTANEEADLVKQFGQDAVNRLKIAKETASKGRNDKERAENEGKIYVWEIWCKTENYVVWIGDGTAIALDCTEPPLDLEGFWPCPAPAYGTRSTSSTIPVPDYVYYQGQCEEIDILTRRINKLMDQLRLKVFYPAGDGSVSPAIEKAMKPDNDTIMVPIPEWAAFTDKGGSNAIVTLPIDQVQKVITACIENRKQLVADVYQITGISDIVRGDTEASETATAQRIKSQWGSIRIRDRQKELARFARDVVRIAAEIICNQFQPETLMLMSGIQLPTMQQKQQAQMQVQQAQASYQQIAARAQQMGQQPPPPPQSPPGFDEMMQQPTIEEVVQLLRDDNMRGFRIDIETDSTIEPDEDAEKSSRMEFAQVIGGFIQQAGPVLAQMPTLIPVFGETLLFVSRAFRTGRQLENSLEQAINQVTQQAMAPKPPPQPSPDEQIKLQTTQVKAQAEQEKARMGVQTAQLEQRSDIEQIRAQGALDAMHHAHETERMEMQHRHEMTHAAMQPRGTVQ